MVVSYRSKVKNLSSIAYSGIKPFVLYPMPAEEAHLCPVRSLAQWINASGITKGYLFRRMASGDRPLEKNSPLVSFTHIACVQLY